MVRYGFLKGILAAVIATSLVTTTVYADEPEVSCKELVDSYMEEQSLQLLDTTGYCYGEICSHGDKPREGIVAAAPEWYGNTCIIYEAIPSDDGYTVGRSLGVYEILDTGYGASTGDGVRSKIRKDKTSRGTIEAGLCIDRYCSTIENVKAWAKATGGKIFFQLIEAEG